MKHASLFSGIGGFDLSAERMGWENIFHCEWNPFCQKILKQHFPNAISYGDITKTDFTQWKGKIDIVSGGFPCQPYSVAGKRKGKDDERHLWPEMLRAIREIQPGWIVGENVPGLLSWERGMVLAEIKADLEGAGFEVFPPCVLPACGKNAPHRRDRLWIIAHSVGHGKRKLCSVPKGRDITEERKKASSRFEMYVSNGITTDTESNGLQGSEINGSTGRIGQNGNKQLAGLFQSTWEKFPTQSPIFGRNDGLSNRVDRIKALGNAIVPQVAFEIFKAIEQTENKIFL